MYRGGRVWGGWVWGQGEMGLGVRGWEHVRLAFRWSWLHCVCVRARVSGVWWCRKGAGEPGMGIAGLLRMGPR